jgi:stearoyl-CoA desaturase (delta-9 desaturase)
VDPFWAAGVINGLGHFWGYRNYNCADASTNLFPWGILIGGEELHNNHHSFATSAKLSARWYEFDIGWMYIRMLECSVWPGSRRPSHPAFGCQGEGRFRHPAGHHHLPLRRDDPLCAIPQVIAQEEFAALKAQSGASSV